MKNTNVQILYTELPKRHGRYVNGGEYMLEPHKWVKIIKYVCGDLYKVYSSSSWSDLPRVVNREDEK